MYKRPKWRTPPFPDQNDRDRVTEILTQWRGEDASKIRRCAICGNWMLAKVHARCLEGARDDKAT